MKKVRAIKLGFMPGPAVHRVREGAVVEVPDDFEAEWFVVVGGDKSEPKKPRGRGASTLSEMSRVEVKGPLD